MPDRPLTVRLYHDDPTLETTRAMITGIADNPSRGMIGVTLDRTVFYPEGGGQPCDLGTISGIPVADAREEGGTVIHFIDGPVPWSVGDEVRLELDGYRRRDHTEQHSAQHLLSSVMLDLFGAATVSFHLGKDRSTIDVESPSFNDAMLAEAESRTDLLIRRNLRFITHRCPPEDIGSFRLRKNPPVGEEEIRIVEIEGIDFSPCCGTHAGSTLALRMLKLLAAEKYKGMSRITFVAGSRAFDDYRAKHDTADRMAKLFSVPIPEVAAKAMDILKKSARNQADLDYLSKRNAVLGVELAAAAQNGLPPAVIVRLDGRGADATAAQESARAYADRGCTAIVVSVQDLTVCCAGNSGARPAALAAALGGPLKASGGRGGGSGNNFRATFADAAALESFVAVAGVIVGASPS